eukprot:CCRYP_018961-RA/>CCRYP_018961-RA protein AED:0.27 eAED:0.27 QI:0/-1/0/1/-1/1/1/0/119
MTISHRTNFRCGYCRGAGGFVLQQRRSLKFRQPRMLIVHEVMGRDSGYLTAATARKYREMYSKTAKFPAPGFTTTRMSRDVHAVWIPEVQVNIAEEGARLKKIMDELGCVDVFLSEGAV